MDLGTLLIEKAEGKGTPTKLFIPQTLLDRMADFQAAYKAKNKSHASKEKVVFLLACEALESLTEQLTEQTEAQ